MELISRASEIRFVVNDKYAIEAKNQNKYRFSNAGSVGLAGSDGLVDTINDLLSKYGYHNKITNYLCGLLKF